jgi:hypothetical protein
MTVTLRQLSRSRRLWAMGALAWLMLALNALVAWPGHATAAWSQQAHRMTMAVGVHDHHHAPVVAAHAGCDVPDGCSGTPTAQACHCAATSCSVLPSVVPDLPLAFAPSMRYGVPPRIGMPSPATAAPLRPPAA